jgi:DNA-binding MarR family transcriptional regulator
MFFFFLGAREPYDSPALERFAHALKIVQLRYPSMTLGQLSTLMNVGMAPHGAGQSVSVSEIVAKSNGQKYPTVARQLDLLADGTDKAPGMKLIEKAVDPEDRRNRYVAVSEQGRNLLYELDLILAPEIATKAELADTGK